MIMHAQVTDFLDLMNEEISDQSAGEISFFVPRQREFDQVLEFDDLTDLIGDDDMSMIPDMESLLDPDCQVAETVTIEVLSNESTLDSTPSTSGTTQSENSVFRFPPVDNSMSATSFGIEDDSTNLSCSSSQYSPSIPPTPSTASSVDSNSSHIPTFLRMGLKQRVQSRRLQEGKGELQVEFKEPEPECLTAEEEELRRIRREKNRKAAQKCRSKKREKADVLEAETKKLQKTQGELNLEIQKLIEERDSLMDIIRVHSAVCPNLRAQSVPF